MCEVIERSLDTATGSEVITLMDCFGHKQVITIAITGERCPHCGHGMAEPGEVDIEQVIADAKSQMEAREEKLLKHAAARGFDVEALKKNAHRTQDQASDGSRPPNAARVDGGGEDTGTAGLPHDHRQDNRS